MAYSDYGGYAYRNGERIEGRSDAVFSKDGIKATPGMWPGWTLPEGRNGESYHVILGDGPVFVALYKQTSITIYDGAEQIDLLKAVVTDAALSRYQDAVWIDYRPFCESCEVCSFKVNDHQIDVYWREEDNYYQYVRLTQPNGVIWTGFSGYGVGSGLEDAGYGYSTEERESRLRDLFAKEG